MPGADSLLTRKVPQNRAIKVKSSEILVAETCAATTALGPGLRAVAWVQGCPLACPGCIAPDWIPRGEPGGSREHSESREDNRSWEHSGSREDSGPRVGGDPAGGARTMTPAELAAELLANPDVTGLTFSGGEPMAQAAGLAQVIAIARRRRDLTLICFTGYRLAALTSRPGPGVRDLLAQTDVLIDGPYVAARNDDRGLRGSDNQRVHFLTGRLADAAEELRGGPRRTQIRLRGDSALLVGVPARPVAEAFERMSASEEVS